MEAGLRPLEAAAREAGQRRVRWKLACAGEAGQRWRVRWKQAKLAAVVAVASCSWFLLVAVVADLHQVGSGR